MPERSSPSRVRSAAPKAGAPLTAPSCARKWMSGPAAAWTHSITDRKRQTVAPIAGPTTALQENLPLSAGKGVFSLDKSLSWMTHFSPGRSTSGFRGLNPCRYRRRSASNLGSSRKLTEKVRRERPMSDTANTFRFQVALSFPGGYRARVEKIAEVLADRLGRGKILYDKWYGAEFARPNLDVYLPELYHKESLLLVFFLSSEYVTKEWCGLEWRAGRDLLKQGEDDRLMFLRLDHADIPGLYSIYGYLDISGMADGE